MLGRRAAGIYIVLVLIFTGMLCRMYALSMGETLSSAANTQSAFVLGVDDTRGILKPGYRLDALLLKGDPSDPAVFREGNPADAVFLAGKCVK